jgi:threonine/homoserine/homoserine lactone efflux protein
MGEIVIYAAGVAISPVPVAAVIVVLTGRRALANGLSFLAGWALGVLSAAVLFVVLVDRAGISDADPLWIAIPEIVLGVAFVAAALVLLARRRNSRARDVPWLDAADALSRSRSSGLGLLLSAANPKVVALALGAALALAEQNAERATTAQAVALFTVIGSVGVAVPLALRALFPRRAALLLARLRAWLGKHETAILVPLGLVIGAVFLEDGLASLRGS